MYSIQYTLLSTTKCHKMCALKVITIVLTTINGIFKWYALH